MATYERYPHFQTPTYLLVVNIPKTPQYVPVVSHFNGIHWHPLASLSPYLRWWQRDHHLVSMRTAAWRLVQGDSNRWWLKDHRSSGMEHCWEAPNFWWSWFSQLIIRWFIPDVTSRFKKPDTIRTWRSPFDWMNLTCDRRLPMWKAWTPPMLRPRWPSEA